MALDNPTMASMSFSEANLSLFTDKQNEILKAITKEEVNALAKKQLTYDKMAILVVGDKSKVFEPLLKLGYEVIELDADGNLLKAPELKTVDPPKKSPGSTSGDNQKLKVTPRNVDNPR